MANPFLYISPSGARQKIREFRSRLYDKRLVFVHIPKCGGTSLSHVLRWKFLFSNKKIDEVAATLSCPYPPYSKNYEFKANLVKYYLNSGAHYVEGHFPFSDALWEGFKNDTNFVTLMRDPVSRVISHYNYDPMLNSLPPDEFLRSELSSYAANLYGHFLGELKFDERPSNLDHVEKSIANLEKINAIILEQPRSMESVFSQLGLRPGKLPKRNSRSAAPAPVRQVEFTEKQKAMIRDICEGDIAIYNAAVERYLARAG
ncbi:conserved hypothetical protein [Oceanicaulis sp. 350]|nr:conserved hypothetical protein [Oceanicaulis sp. 350]